MLSDLETISDRSSRQRVYTRVRSLLSADRCQVGYKLPTARALAKHFRVGVATAHQALHLLEKEGLVRCEVGRGTFVCRTLNPEETGRRDSPGMPTIGVLTGVSHERHELHGPRTDWVAGILFGIQQGLMENGAAVHLIPFDYGEERLAVAADRLTKLASALSGVITFSYDRLGEVISVADRLGKPCVTIDQYNHMTTENFVAADYYGGGYEIGRLFGEAALERVLFLKPRVQTYSAALMLHGLRDGISAGGRSPNAIDSRACGVTPYTVQNGKDATAAYLSEAVKPPQAILATGDLLALGAIHACQERGLRVPDDVAVVGGSGLEVGEYSVPTLSTIQMPIVDTGKAAAGMLLHLIRKGEKRMAGRILPVRVIRRNSTPVIAACNAP